MSDYVSPAAIEKLLEAAVMMIVPAAALILPPAFAAVFAEVYLRLACPRAWPMRLFGTTTLLAASFFLEEHVFMLDLDPWALSIPRAPWAVLVPSGVFAVLLAVDCMWYGFQWRPGTDLMIARVVEEDKQNRAHKHSWLVFANEELGQDHFRSIENRFCGFCPEPNFDQPCGLQPSVDVRLRAVQFYSSHDGHLMRRVSKWCAPKNGQPVEFDFATSWLEWVDNVVFRNLGTAGLLNVLYTSFSTWSDFVSLAKFVLLAVVLASSYAERLFELTCWWTSTSWPHGRSYAVRLFETTCRGAGNAWPRVKNSVVRALVWLDVAILPVVREAVLFAVIACAFFINLGSALLSGYYIFCTVQIAWEIVLLLATAPVVHAKILLAITQARDAVVLGAATAYSAALKLFVVVCSAVLWLAVGVGLVCVTAVLARTVVLAIKAARGKCKSVLASGYRQHTIRKAQRAAGRPRKSDSFLDGDKTKDSTSSPFVSAVLVDLIHNRKVGGEPGVRRSFRLRVAREKTQISYKKQMATENRRRAKPSS